MPTFPNHPAKHDGSPLVTPERFLTDLLGDPERVVPEAIIMGYNPRLPTLLEERGFHRHTGYRTTWRALWRHPEIPVGVVEGFGVGAPAAAIVLEEVATLGARRVVSLGMAGALSHEVDFGDVVLCTRAIRDEGVSHHYRPAARFAYPSATLTQRLRATLATQPLPFVDGPTWTLDAIYRETLEEATAYRDEGVVTVDMEAAALFVVAESRGVDAAAIFSVSDHLLAGPEWSLAPDRGVLAGGLARLVDTALRALSD